MATGTTRNKVALKPVRVYDGFPRAVFIVIPIISLKGVRVDCACAAHVACVYVKGFSQMHWMMKMQKEPDLAGRKGAPLRQIPMSEV